MGCKNSKKINKNAEKQKLCKVGLSLGRNDLKVEGNFQIGYHSKTDKKYTNVDGIYKTDLATIEEENNVDGIYKTDLPSIEEEKEENNVDGIYKTDLPTIEEEKEEENE